MLLNEQSTQLLLTTISQCLCKQCSDFRFYSVTEPPKPEILYAYTACAHILNHGPVELRPFSTKEKGLVCCEVNQKFEKLCSD